MRRRLTAAIVAVTAVTLALLGIPLAVALHRSYRNAAVVELQREAAEATAEVVLPLDATRIAQDLEESGDADDFSVYGEDGRLVFGTGPPVADESVRQALGGEPADASVAGAFVVATPISSRSTERVVGAVRTTISEAVVEARVTRAWAVMLGSAAAALVVAWLVARNQATRLTRPVEKLADAARRLGDGEFSVRTSPSGVPELDVVGAALDTSGERLAGLLARERAFSADVSHQLRTPLTGLRLRLDEAATTGDRDALEAARREVERLEATVEHLLALAHDRLPVGDVLAIAPLAQEARARWEPPVRHAGRSFEIDVGSALPTVRASGTAVQQVLDVLIGNALEHGAGTIRVAVRAAAGGLIVDVEDGGSGIAPDDVTGVFERHNGDGSGIGLALARSIAEAEGGRLVLAAPSPPRFSLVLPSAD